MPVITGRGLRSKIGDHDRLLMVLCYLKHYETLDKMKETFQLSKTHLYRILDTTMNAITPILSEMFIEEAEISTPDDTDDFPQARFVMDTTFQPIWTPLGTFEERKRFYSGKHKQYGLKSQCLHDRTGRLLHCVSGIPGAMHDLTIARQTIAQVCISSRKGLNHTSHLSRFVLFWKLILRTMKKMNHGLSWSIPAIKDFNARCLLFCHTNEHQAVT